MIVVSPDIDINGNGGGWCTDSYDGGAGGPPEWEAFHIDELLPWVDANLRTIATRQGRAIFGLSQGGFCAMSYAARHPDLFSIAGSFSGADDIAFDPLDQLEGAAIIDLTAAGLDGAPPESFFGDPYANAINWQDHDPTTLAENLADTRLFEYTGDGMPGPLDTGLPNLEGMVIEAGVDQMTNDFHDRLETLGIPSTFLDYGPGTHSWPYWARDLKWSISRIAADFATPASNPAAVDYTIADPSYSIYGWSVQLTPATQRFTTLSGADVDGFALQGTGSATVTTPASYSPNTAVDTSLGSVRSDASGRLTLDVPLGTGAAPARVAITPPPAPVCAGRARARTSRHHRPLRTPACGRS
jgi:S-formylglutathione hydrolase FrmB